MTIAESIESFLLEELGADVRRQSLDHDADLIEGRVIDSLAILKLVTFLEERCGVKVADEDVVPENFQSINSLVAFVDRKTAGSS
jgi:acyl carrier protein